VLIIPSSWGSQRAVTYKPSSNFSGPVAGGEEDFCKGSLSRTIFIVGMTNGACHGPSYLPAGVPGISTALRREDRLRPEGRLRQQPAGDSTEESQNRAMKTKALQQLSRWAPTRAAEAKDRSDERHDRTQPISDQGAFPTTGSEAKGRVYASQMPVQGERRLIKRDRQSRARGSRRGRGHGEAGSRPNHHLTCNQTPRLYKGVWTLSLGDPIFFFLL
jgi:hypothetical protein